MSGNSHRRLGCSFSICLSVGLFTCFAMRPGALLAADKAPSRRAEADKLLSQENYDAIAVGMTSDEVKAILGKPSSGVGRKGDWTDNWQLSADHAQVIHVHFKGDEVDRKSNSMEWDQTATASTGDPAKTNSPAKAGKPAKEPDDKIRRRAAALFVGEAKQKRAARRTLMEATPDAEHAQKVVNVVSKLLHDKDFGASMDARTILRKWNNKDTNDVFLKMLEKKPSTKDLKDENRLAFAMEMVVKVKDPRGSNRYARFCIGRSSNEMGPATRSRRWAPNSPKRKCSSA